MIHDGVRTDSIQSSVSLPRSQTYSANEVDLILTPEKDEPIEWVEIDPEAFTGTEQPFIIFWTQKSAPAYSAWTTQRTESGPSSIVQAGRWSTHGIPQMTWSTRRSCLIWSSRGSPSSTSSTSSCPARSYPHWWYWPTSYLHKVGQSCPLSKYYIVIRLQDGFIEQSTTEEKWCLQGWGNVTQRSVLTEEVEMTAVAWADLCTIGSLRKDCHPIFLDYSWAHLILLGQIIIN